MPQRPGFQFPHMPNSMPGPPAGWAGPLPPSLPAGQMPPEDSRLWVFTPAAVVKGEAFIQDDTRAWFEDRGRKVVIGRNYRDHPRWMVKGEASVRAKMHNAHIMAEVHMLARISVGMPDLPAWVAARMTVKQTQADLAYRLTYETRKVFVQQGRAAMEAFAERAPGQFIRFVGSTFIAKKIESNLEITGGTVDKERIGDIISAMDEELKRRAAEAKVIAVAMPLDHNQPTEIVDAMQAAGRAVHAVTEPRRAIGQSKMAGAYSLPSRLRSDLKMFDLVDEIEEPKMVSVPADFWE